MQKRKEIKVRRSWKINPATRIKDSDKYNRAREKEKVKRVIEDAINSK